MTPPGSASPHLSPEDSFGRRGPRVCGTLSHNAAFRHNSEVVIAARPNWRERDRCGVCRRRCPGFDLGEGRRRWRALDLGTTFAFVEAAAPRVSCRRHGVVVCAVPVGAAWLALHVRVRRPGGVAGGQRVEVRGRAVDADRLADRRRDLSARRRRGPARGRPARRPQAHRHRRHARHVAGHQLDLGAALLAERVQERLDRGAVTAGGRPDQPARVAGRESARCASSSRRAATIPRRALTRRSTTSTRRSRSRRAICRRAA